MSNQTEPTSNNTFFNRLPSYTIPIASGYVATYPMMHDMMGKSAIQRGLSPPKFDFFNVLKAARNGSRTVGALIGIQMIAQEALENLLVKEDEEKSFGTIFASASIVGLVSSLPIAIYNGQTMEWPVMKSIRLFTPQQAAAITVQETSFVAAIAAIKLVTPHLKAIFGDNQAVESGSAFVTGAGGSILTHAANTFLTRSQNDLPIESLRQLMWGVGKKARAVGIFAVTYNLAQDFFHTINRSKST
ncbi:MAG: hypothetical protein S4CHLAM20_11440 [Chlamydiia bacterium]|nr:hypothetical protein [Chlamydiia bacterium]